MNTTTEPENNKTEEKSIFEKIKHALKLCKKVFITFKWWLSGLLSAWILYNLWPYSQDSKLWIGRFLMIVTITAIVIILRRFSGYSAIKKWILVNRERLLIISAILGIALVLWWYVDRSWLPSPPIFGEIAQIKNAIGIDIDKTWLPSLPIFGDIVQFKNVIGIDIDIDIDIGQVRVKDNWLNSSLTTLLLALPTLFVLWVLRTNDTREQIEETQNNTLTSILSHAMDMITSDDFKRRYAGLIQLGQLRKQTAKFNAQINSATRNLDLKPLDLDGKPLSDEEDIVPNDYQRALLMNAYLRKIDLNDAELRGADLTEADLTEAVLSGANLGGTNLGNANLSGADLGKVILSGANLSGANLGKVNLSGTNLSGADLRNVNLSDTNLSNAILRETYLRDANLSSVDLNGAVLSGTDLTDADLTGANLAGADLREAVLANSEFKNSKLNGADLTNADLNGAKLNDVDLTDADLSSASLTDADLKNAKLVGADLSSASLEGAKLSGADLTNADLNGANLSDVDMIDIVFSSANLTNAKLCNANLIGSILTDVDLSGSDLTDAYLTGATLTGAKYNDRTKLPDDFDPNAEGMIWVGDSDEDDEQSDE